MRARLSLTIIYSLRIERARVDRVSAADCPGCPLLRRQRARGSFVADLGNMAHPTCLKLPRSAKEGARSGGRVVSVGNLRTSADRPRQGGMTNVV
jgi:hypothetical protein